MTTTRSKGNLPAPMTGTHKTPSPQRRKALRRMGAVALSFPVLPALPRPSWP